VAVPLDWDDIADPEIRGNAFTTRNVLQRLDRKGDPWKGMARRARSLEGPRARLAALEQEEGSTGGGGEA
jgi:bifunctional non-homologous end joining protein LigD